MEPMDVCGACVETMSTYVESVWGLFRVYMETLWSLWHIFVLLGTVAASTPFQGTSMGSPGRSIRFDSPSSCHSRPALYVSSGNIFHYLPSQFN